MSGLAPSLYGLRTLALLVSLGSCFVRAPVLAQDDTPPPVVDLTDTVDAYNTSAVVKIVEGEHDTAIALLSSALVLQENNVVHLNLGRAYAKAGNCVAARAHYELAATAPRVRAPTPDEVETLRLRYLGELDECETVSGVGTSVPLSTVAWWLAGSGAALAAAGTALVLVAYADRNDATDLDASPGASPAVQSEASNLRDQAQTFDAVGYTLFGVGAATLGSGLFLLLWDGDQPATGVSLAPRSGSALLTWSGRW